MMQLKTMVKTSPNQQSPESLGILVGSFTRFTRCPLAAAATALPAAAPFATSLAASLEES